MTARESREESTAQTRQIRHEDRAATEENNL